MIRLVTRTFYCRHYQIDISYRHPWSCDAVKHFGTEHNKVHRQHEQNLYHIDSLRSSNIPGNKAPPKPALEDDSQTLLQHIVKYVEKTTYMDDVRRAQSKVMDIKKHLLQAGEEKRMLMKKLEDLRNDLSHVYKDMKINRSKENYLDLARQEIELCEMEKQYNDMYKHFDKQEQCLFTEFSDAINESYEKEKLHTNFIKVISIIGTITSSFVALLLSILFHAFQYNKFNSIKPIDEDVLVSIRSRLRSVEENLMSNSENRESWGSYLHRNTRWVYSWAVKSK